MQIQDLKLYLIAAWSYTAQSYMIRSLDSIIEIHCFSYKNHNLWVGHHGHHIYQHNHLHIRDEFPAFDRSVLSFTMIWLL